ncbi:MAG TPA: hypothetical protein VGN90_12270 [Pyrinomonadaceae bacterium]|jgi:CheY-like chemotaxis protein|nr:hypothetical protein [Pyrinomonadaceae bacterium]
MADECPHRKESRFRLLFLGNDLDLIAVLGKALAEADYRLVSCSDRESAIMFIKSDIPYNLLLLDLEWQGAEGLKMAELARSLRHRKRMPIILVAASGLNSQLQTLADAAGVKQCVTKTPVKAISEAIRQWVEKPRRKK